MRDVEAVLARVAERRPRIIDLSLDRVFTALQRLGDPHLRLPPIIHVAGTNGKGSTIAFMRAVLEAAGKSVHVYTSPHLVRFNERIVVAGEEIVDAALIDALTRCEESIGDAPLTYFEATTCAALVAFSETPADFALIEVGLGGRLDATNVFDNPLATVVTPVDLDHQQFLGDTLALVAAEKAGIFRKGAPAVIAPQNPDVAAVLENRAAAVGAPLFMSGMQWTVYAEHGRLIYQDERGLADLDPPRLVGAHQIENAGTALAALRAAGLAIDNAVLSAGLMSAHWPARLQRLSKGPLIDLAAEMLGEAPEIWLDGGHNPHAGRILARAMADMEERRPRPLAMIAGMQKNKDAAGYFAPFKGVVSAVYAVAANHDNVAAPAEIAAAAETAGLAARGCASLEDAMRLACAENKNEPPRFLIGGSLYLAGEVLRSHA